MDRPPQSYLNHRRKTLPVVMPDDSDPLHNDLTKVEQKRPDVQVYPQSSAPNAETHTPNYSGRPSIGLDVPGAVQTREPPGKWFTDNRLHFSLLSALLLTS